MDNAFKIIVLITLLGLTACAANDPYQRTKTGAAVGAVAGAILGHQLDDDAGRYVGAAVGALAGGTVGNYMDRQQHAFDQALAEEQRHHGLEIQRLQDGSIKLDIPSEVSFDFDSAAIKPAFVPPLEKVANIVRQYDKTIVHIAGHTDSVGPDAYNMTLSQRRADSVAQFLAERGVAWQRLRAEGRGEREPRASNTTAAGRQLNRRVEMIIKPVVEGQEQRAYETSGGGYQQDRGYNSPPPGGYPQQSPTGTQRGY